VLDHARAADHLLPRRGVGKTRGLRDGGGSFDVKIMKLCAHTKTRVGSG